MLYKEEGILVNCATFTDGENWFELIGTIGTACGRFSFMQAAFVLCLKLQAQNCAKGNDLLMLWKSQMLSWIVLERIR